MTERRFSAVLALLVAAMTLAGCVGALWTDRDTGKVETRVYTPLDLLPDGADTRDDDGDAD